MYLLLISIVIGLFIAMLFLNIYFVEFGASHIFNDEKMATEIYPRYPDQVDNIKTFVNHIRYSIKMATVLTTLISAFGAILMYYRHD